METAWEKFLITVSLHPLGIATGTMGAKYLGIDRHMPLSCQVMSGTGAPQRGVEQQDVPGVGICSGIFIQIGHFCVIVWGVAMFIISLWLWGAREWNQNGVA